MRITLTFLQKGDMENIVNSGLRWKFKFVCHRAHASNDFGLSMSHTGLLIRLQFHKHLVTSSKLNMHMMSVSLIFHVELGSLNVNPKLSLELVSRSKELVH